MVKDRTFVPVMGLIAFGVMVLASGVQAQSPQRDPRSIEIAGVHLGMSREQAIKALMANDPPFVDDETGGRSSAQELKVPVLSPDPFVWSMKFRAKVTNAVDEPSDHVELHFAPLPSESTILTLNRGTCFSCGNGKAMVHAPSVPNFLDAIAKRFGAANASVIQGRNTHNTPSGTIVVGEMRYYAWTRSGQLLSGQEFQRRVKYPAQCTRMATPDDARNAQGINFRAFQDLAQKEVLENCAVVASVQWRQDGKGAIDSFYITVSDYAGILSAFSKAAEVVEGKADQQRKQELDRASKNSTKL